MKKRVFAALLIACMAGSSFAGCGPKENDESSKESSSATSSSSASSSEKEKDIYGADFAGYPLDGKEELTFYTLEAYTVPDGVSRNDNIWNQQLAERVGIDIKWHEVPVGGNPIQSYNLMIASDDLPDIFYRSSMGSIATQLIDDKKIITLNDYLETYAPSYYEVVTSDESRNKAVKNDRGEYYGFAFLRESLKMGTYAGPIIRKDLLDTLKMDAPETIEEWDKVLTEMKNQNLVKYPLSTIYGIGNLSKVFCGAYNTIGGFYVADDGKVHFGNADPAMKDWLSQLKTWYDNGFLDPDFMTNDDPALETKVLNSEIGACFSTGGTVTDYVMKLEKSGIPDQWMGITYPTAEKGQIAEFNQGESNNIGYVGVITTSCKNVPLACRFLDYGYTKDGQIFFNYGDEANYEIVDGKPRFTDEFKNDSRGFSTMERTYTAMGANSATLHMASVFDGFIPLRQDCVNNWYTEESQKHYLPASLTMTSEESSSIANELTAVWSYVNEKEAQFVFGQESLDNFDQYVEDLNKMGLEHILEVHQAAYDRYLGR